jgi:hypothetical protein
MPLYRRLYGIVPLIVFAAILCGEGSSRADAVPQPPCGSATFPPYPSLENSPAVRTWDRAGSGRDWTPPACTWWPRDMRHPPSTGKWHFTDISRAFRRTRNLPRPHDPARHPVDDDGAGLPPAVARNTSNPKARGRIHSQRGSGPSTPCPYFTIRLFFTDTTPLTPRATSPAFLTL